MRQLYVGGARSGKSRLAQELATDWQREAGGEVAVIATAEPKDEQMAKRIAHHKQHRPADWLTVECSLKLSETLLETVADSRIVLVDCLTLWACNQLLSQPDSWQQEKQKLVDTIAGIDSPLLLISNEIGQGVVPLGEFNRRFVDELGWLNQAVAKKCDRVVQAVAGLPLVLKENNR